MRFESSVLSIVKPSTLVVLNLKPETAEVEGGPLTPSTVKVIAVPLGILVLRTCLKETTSVSADSPLIKVQLGMIGPKLVIAQSTLPGEVDVEM